MCRIRFDEVVASSLGTDTSAYCFQRFDEIWLDEYIYIYNLSIYQINIIYIYIELNYSILQNVNVLVFYILIDRFLFRGPKVFVYLLLMRYQIINYGQLSHVKSILQREIMYTTIYIYISHKKIHEISHIKWRLLANNWPTQKRAHVAPMCNASVRRFVCQKSIKIPYERSNVVMSTPD